MLFYSKTRKIKYFWDPPPTKRLRDTNVRDMHTHTSAVYTSSLWPGYLFTRTRLSDSDYKVIPSLRIIILS